MLRPILICMLLVLASCSSPLEVKTLAGKEFFELNKVKLIERNQDSDFHVRFGVVSDIHGNMAYTEKIRKRFLEENVGYVFILGDSVLNEQLRTGEVRDDTQEMIDVLTVFSKLGIPVFVMPGNHEGSATYRDALTQLASGNIVDMMQYRILDLDDASFIAVPGYHDARFLPRDGYLYTQKDLSFIHTVASALNTQPILLSHGPPQTQSGQGIDFVHGAGNVGDPQLNLILQTINYSISGHIHEAGPKIVDAQSQELAFGTPLSQAWINAGAGTDGYALIVDMDKGILTTKSIQVK